ncbi:hypothetical protein GIB67_002991, partial [Kingdonia uniflora]
PPLIKNFFGGFASQERDDSDLFVFTAPKSVLGALTSEFVFGDLYSGIYFCNCSLIS